MKLSSLTLLVVCILGSTASVTLAVPAFPGAEGYGAVATGGRGGAVYEVTNLNDSGTGSFRAAVLHSGARTVVFRVSGTIYLYSSLNTTYDNLTIAGQTAPGDGIALAGDWLQVNSNNVIIRYIRCRLGDVRGNGSPSPDTDAIGGRYKNNIIIDHVTASWSIDETFSLYVNTNFTAQWCMITESLYRSHHYEEGLLQNHGYGGIWGGIGTSWHHNLFAHHDSRNPRIGGEAGVTADMRNNVIYNWGNNSCYGGEDASINLVNCYYKYGPATGSSKRSRIANPSYVTGSSPHDYGQWYINGNYVYGNAIVTADNWNGGVNPQGGDGEKSLCKSITPFPAATTYPVTEQTAINAYDYVLNSVGCSIVRDSLDRRITNEVRTGTAHYGGSYPNLGYGGPLGIIDSQVTVGGWPTLNSTTAPTDTDHDGMPDAWETAHGLTPTNAADRNYYTLDADYTNLEVYINSLCPDPYTTDGLTPLPDAMTWLTVPHAAGTDSITMVATTATDVSGVEYYFTCTAGGGHDSAWQDGTTYTDTGLLPSTTYTYTVKARDKSANKNTTAASVARSATTSTPPDYDAPTPNPMTWFAAPHGTDIHSISMTATTAIDTSGVEYLFTCTSGGGTSSAWQDSPTYVDSSLTEGQTCAYTVTARDKSPNQNTTAPSTPDASASALLDTTAPTPNPMTFAAAPVATGLDTVTMTASVATDISDVEYFFQNTTNMSHFSGWQDSEVYTDTALVNNTTYAYRVMARDKSLSQNQTAWSEPNSATTLRYLCTSPIISDLSTDCQVNFSDYALLAAAWSQIPPTVDFVVNGTFETDTVPGWQIFDSPTATGIFAAAFDDTTGDPAGSAIVVCDTDVTGTKDYYFYQTIRVKVASQYRFSAQWSGDLSQAAVDPLNCGLWAEVMIGFAGSTDPNTWTFIEDTNSTTYGKSFGVDVQNIDPTGIWGWEQVTASPVNGPSDGLFTATDNYMVIAFTVGGLPSSGVGLYNIDNIRVEGPGCTSVDFNGDCSLDFLDLRQFAADWLTCNRDPAGECWQ